jgi:hypothetical protein
MASLGSKCRRHAAIGTALACFALASSVSAQSFAGGGALATWQPDNSPYVGTQNPSVPTEGIHGSAPGWFGTIGVFPSPHVGIAAELSMPNRFTADQVADKYRTHNTHRDVILSGLLHLRPSTRVVDAVIGLSYVREQTNQQIALRAFSSPGVIYQPFDAQPESIVRNTFGLTGGLDVPLSLGRHVSVTPQLRVHWIARENDSTAASPRFLGLSSIVIRPACGIRATF